MTTGRTRGAKAGRSTRTATVLVAMAPACVALAFASASSAATLQVCPHGCQYSQIAAAVAAARGGDHVTVAAGTYQGGFTIRVSLTLTGAGASQTIIKGGGPVVTVGAGGSSKLNVAISGVTITGGVAHSSPDSADLYGPAGVLASGGGIEITPDNITTSPTTGATVVVSNSVITGNSVAPTAHVPSPAGAQCPGGPNYPGGTCKFADAFGGGIYNAGDLTLTNTTVADNSSVSTFASDAGGGGIYNEMGSLTVINSTISTNRTGVTAPYGRYADGGAIVCAGGTLTIRGSSISDNTASTITAWPSSVDPEAHGGAIHVETGNATPTGHATISHTKITGNTVKMTNSVGAAFADSGGLKADLAMTVTDDVIADNHVVVAALGSGGADGDSGAGELWGTVTGTRLTDNTVTVSARKGDALASSGASLIQANLTDSLVSGNHVRAISAGGSAMADAGGIQVSGGVSGPVAETLRSTPVSDNTARATARGATAQGGGVFDIAIQNGPPGGVLTLINSNVSDNTLSGSANAKLQGGAVFTTFKLTLTNSALTANTPGECAGSGC